MVARLLLLVLFLAPGLARAQLAVVDAYFEDYDRRLVRDQKLPAGETVYLSFRVAGYREDPQHRVRLAWFVDCLDPRKVPLAETTSDKIEATLAPQDENWRPKVNWSLVVPAYAPGGEYQVLIRVRDEIAAKEAQHQMSFQVRGETLQPASSLGVQGFEFADTENGKAKTTPAYTRGSTLWARFRVTGYRISPEKQVSVEVDLSVLDDTGKVLFSKPEAAVEKNRMFYPPRFLLEIFNLDLQPSVKPGEYTIHLDLRDLVGQQQAQYETKFTVLP